MKPGETISPSASIVRAAGVADLADLDDAAVLDADVRREARLARAVDDGAAANDHIQCHALLPLELETLKQLDGSGDDSAGAA